MNKKEKETYYVPKRRCMSFGPSFAIPTHHLSISGTLCPMPIVCAVATVICGIAVMAAADVTAVRHLGWVVVVLGCAEVGARLGSQRMSVN